MERFNYHELVQHFESSLLTTLRAHSAASELFEMWVPDPDVLQSIINMVDNFDFDEHDGFILEVSKDVFGAQQQEELKDMASSIATLSITEQDDLVVCTFTEGT